MTNEPTGGGRSTQLKYARGVAPGTELADRNTGKPPTEDQMLLEMELRLRVAARTNEVALVDDTWWSSQPVKRGSDEEDGAADRNESGQRMRVRVPAAALERAGAKLTAERLGMVTELVTHALIRNEGAPTARRTGDPSNDDAMAGYIAGAAGDMATHFGQTGKWQPSQARLPAEEREVLFLDLEYFDEMIAERYDKRLTEADAYEEAGEAERRHFDPATSAAAREELQAMGLDPGPAHERPGGAAGNDPAEAGPAGVSQAARPPRQGGYSDVPTPPARPATTAGDSGRSPRNITPTR